MSTVKYTDNHEWLRLENNTTAVVGITEHAQEQLGELVFIELPEVGATLAKGDDAAVIESVKAASELKSPLSGRVVAVNELLNEEPTKVNEDAQGEGWFYKIELSDPSELDSLLDEAAYQALIA
ncbi:MAG: glycine cleavage system protein GcvH [Candidatus Competibacteraceae bacterium]|nr:glycine cleavage system protein GcvH [Candidatus Competibacteraceae bacterium]MCB1810624.1 glycine cleavage system protein GcvH [Candidatus Competibacteraceae bacterium]